MDGGVDRSLAAEGAIRVTDAEVIAAQILVRQARRRGEQVDEATEAIANARPSPDAGSDYKSAKIVGASAIAPKVARRPGPPAQAAAG